MGICQVVLGFVVSTLGGAFVLWLLIDMAAWSYLTKKTKTERKYATLTLPLGIVERGLYTTSLIIGAPEWIAVWLAVKVAVTWGRWQGEQRGTYNLFLIGNALSIAFGLIGAWIALGHLPYFK